MWRWYYCGAGMSVIADSWYMRIANTIAGTREIRKSKYSECTNMNVHTCRLYCFSLQAFRWSEESTGDRSTNSMREDQIIYTTLCHLLFVYILSNEYGCKAARTLVVNWGVSWGNCFRQEGGWFDEEGETLSEVMDEDELKEQEVFEEKRQWSDGL
jgi:hypothetical protein